MHEVASRRWTWAIGLVSFLGQLAVGSIGRAPAWDEAIYLSQVTRGAPDLPFVASRARGITLLVAPLTSGAAPLWTVRLFLALVSSLVLVAVFRAWVPVVGVGAVVGAGVFAASWPALFYGSEVMPNLWAALFAVGTVGFFARCVMDMDIATRPTVWLAVMAFLTALMRPSDAVVLGVALTAGAMVMSRWRFRALAALWIGVIVGILPWLIEMSVRYGGPLGAIEAARKVSHFDATGGISAHLALTDGPLLGPEAGGAIPFAGAAWWIGLLALTAVAAVHRRSDRLVIGVRLAAAAGIALALVYLFLIAGLAPRFLLPALALLSLTAGCGIQVLWSPVSFRRSALVGTAAALVGWGAWQVFTFDRLEAVAAAERARPQAIGLAIGEHLGSSASCLVASTDDYPQVAFAAGCAGRALEDVSEENLESLPSGADGRRVIVVSREASGSGPGSEPIALPSADRVAFEIPVAAT